MEKCPKLKYTTMKYVINVRENWTDLRSYIAESPLILYSPCQLLRGSMLYVHKPVLHRQEKKQQGRDFDWKKWFF